MRKTFKRRARKNRTRKGGVSLANRVRGLFSRKKPVNTGPKNVLNEPKNILDRPNNNGAINNGAINNGAINNGAINNGRNNNGRNNNGRNNNRQNNNQPVESTNRPTLMGSNIIGTINPNIARKYPGNQGPNTAPGFRPPVFGPERNQPPWA
jgi:hypothetical protein